jgi:hypothetical protein
VTGRDSGEINLDLVEFHRGGKRLYSNYIGCKLIQSRRQLSFVYSNLQEILDALEMHGLVPLHSVHPANIDQAPHAFLLIVGNRHHLQDVNHRVDSSLLLVAEEVLLEGIVPAFNVVVDIDARV